MEPESQGGGSAPQREDFEASRGDGEALLNFFAIEARELPWRIEPRDPYHTLVSELMAQQTQIDRVVPKFLEFIRRFPTVDALASAPEDEVLAAWSGLGYYRRARLLHRAAHRVAEAGGELPSRPEDLLLLPGVGPYTAAAVASLAFDCAAAVLDGNVLRVGARVLGLEGDVRRAGPASKIRGWVESFFEWTPPGRVNEALMELGALRCTPKSPCCGGCPFEPACRAHKLGRQEDIPAPRATRSPEHQEWVAACCCREDGALLVRRIDEGEILRGLWLPPIAVVGRAEELQAAAARLLPGFSGPWRALPPVRHSITYRRMRVHPLVTIIRDGEGEHREGRGWLEPGGRELPSSTLLEKLLGRLEEAGLYRAAASGGEKA